MKLSTLSAAVVALALSGSALAAPPSSMTVTVPDPLDTFDSGFLIHARPVGAGESFVDYYKFTLGTASDVYGSLASAKVTLKSIVQKDVAFDSIALSGTGIVGSLASEVALPDFLFSGLSEGSYTLTLSGHATGSKGGSYHGELLSTPAVPEPESIAMALAGAGVVGGLMRRRKVG